MITESLKHFERNCPHCHLTTVHESRITPTWSGSKIIVTVRCLVCYRAQGRIV